ncbi:MAG: CvpA family protein [Clostridia bacterium]|nr:CvpA family protein [Clostridia bacterium]
MDPIKVDFSADNNKSDNSKFVIPPEKKVLRIILSLVITLIGAAIGYYFYLPALNFKSIEMYIFIGAAIAFYCLLNYVMTGALRTPDYAPYAKKANTVPIIILVVLAVVVAGGYVVSSVFFRAKDYSGIIDVRPGSFATEVANPSDDDFNTVPRIDSDTTQVLAERALSDLSEMGYVSQFTVEPSYNQINYKNRPVRIATLQYSNIIKWLTNRSTRIPAFIKIDTITQKTNLVTVKGGIQYSTADHFAHNVKRQIRFAYPTYLFDAPQFEIDDNDKPYWITARLNKTIGLFGGTDVIGVVLCDAVTGECTEYSMEQIKSDESLEWIDRVYSANLLVEQYDYYGSYRGGFWNSILGQKNTYRTTDGYSYLAMNDDVYLYTGVTSLTNDESLTGFTLINMRTKDAVYYTISGAKEASAQTSAEGLVQQYEYKASFPLLLNIDGVPTYFMPLKDSSNLVKMYAMINVNQYSIGAYGTSLKDCIDNYASELKKNNITVDVSTDNITESTEGGEGEIVEPTTVDVTGKIVEIRTAVINGNSVYYIKLDSSKSFYSVKAADFEKVVTLNVNDTVTITVNDTEGEIISAQSVK